MRGTGVRHGRLPAQSEVPGLHGDGDWSAAFLEAVSIESPALVLGHSFGGALVVVLAHDHHSLVRALVLAEPDTFGEGMTNVFGPRRLDRAR